MTISNKPVHPNPTARAAVGESVIVFGMLSLAVWFVYHRALDAPFIFDDTGSVLTNSSIVRLWPLAGVDTMRGPLNPPPFSATAGRPLVNLSFALNYHFGQFDPRGYRWLNLALHALSATLLWSIVNRTSRLPYFAGRFDGIAGPLAFAVALLWVLHPLASEAVAYITQRTELLMSFCYLATLYTSLRYFTTDSKPARTAWLALAVFASAAGMASKEVMASAPLIVLLFDRTFIAGSFRKAFRKSWPLYLGLAATWLLLASLNFSGPRSDTAGFGVDLRAHVWWFTQTKVLLMYLGLAIWPWPLSIHYEFPYLESLTTAWPYAFAVAALGIATLFLLWRNSPVGFIAACVLAILAPTLIVPITTEVAAERRMYLPLAALTTLAVVGGFIVLRRIAPQGRYLPAAIAAVVAIAYGVATANRVELYRDPVALWQDTLAHQPNNAMAHHNVGVALANDGDPSAALAHYEEAVRLKPDFLEAQCNLALALAHLGRSNEAVEHFRAAVTLKPAADRIRNNLAVTLFSAGRLDEAIIEFQKVLQINPQLWEAHDGLARALQQMGRTDDAKHHFDEAKRLRQLQKDEVTMDSDLYDQLWRVEQEHWWFRARRHIVWSLVERFTNEQPGQRLRICDIGCGTGGNLFAMADRYDVTGVEHSTQALEYARRRLGDRVQQGSLPDQINLPAESFDVVLMTDVLEHIEDDKNSAVTALRLLRPGGIVVATVPANPWLYSQFDARLHHFRRYSKSQFRALWNRPDAETILLSHYNALLFPPAATVRAVSKLLPQRDATHDLDVPPRALNFVLTPIMKCESLLLGRVPLPFGLSLVAVVRKR